LDTKTQNHKLVLSQETMRKLTIQEMRQVAGGGTHTCTCQGTHTCTEQGTHICAQWGTHTCVR
jgi:hypothetical protein